MEINSTMKRIRQHIAIVLTLLLLGGIANEAWADVKVTYHIITLPFDNPLTVAVEAYRVEATKCTVTTVGSSATITLPDAFRSPLARNFKYWNTSTVSGKVSDVKVHSPNNCTYTNYGTCTFDGAGDYTENTSTVTVDTDVYVTYEYNASNALGIDLSGTKEYNIELGGTHFLAFNFKRNDRPIAVAKADVSNATLVSSEPVNNYYYLWKYEGSDPYNVTIKSAYAGADEAKRGAQLFSRFGYNMWLTQPNKKFSNGDMQQDLYTSFIILSRGGGIAYMVANMTEAKDNKSPNNSGQYQYLSKDDAANPQAKYKSESAIVVSTPDEVETYTFHVTTLFGNDVSETFKWSIYAQGDNLLTYVPEALRRKYVTITGAYKATPYTAVNAVTTFADVESANNGRNIYLDYTTSMPFETLPADGSYTDAKWYTIRMNNEDQYIVKLDDDDTNFITGGGSNSVLHQGENSAEAQVAFMGDPYELKVLSRAASETNSPNRYIGCPTASATNTQLSVQTGSSDISSWEMIYETGNEGTMLLRQFNTSEAYWGWNYGTTGNPPVYSTSAANRIKVVDLDKKKYVYHIVRSDGSIAVKASEDQDVGKPLSRNTIPEIIRSPFVGTYTFYWTESDAKNATNAKTYAPYDPATQGYNIYVRYTLNDSYTAYINGSTTFNVRLNGQYIYYDSSSGTIKSTTSIVDSDDDGDTYDETAYQWILGGSDPYAMTVQSVGNSDKYVEIADGDADTEPDWATGTISWNASAPASKFIIKATSSASVYEVMAATGDGTDAATTYYNIGRADANTVKVYSNSTYAHGYSQLRFQLTPLTAHNVTYHLIDRAGEDLIQVTTRHADADKPHFPDDYWSPLVETYHYWLVGNFDVIGSKYTLKTSQTELTTVSTYTDIYVTYDTGTDYDLQNKKTMYLLKYEAGTPFHPENGSDGLETSLITPIYPYCNGDCNFFVYGQAQFDLQQQGAASTRTRWAWFLESANNDPYHVKICSRQTETYNGDQARAYFHTYKPSDYSSVVTTLTWPGISGVQGTEYMVLGSTGQFRLVTTYGIDLNNDGDIEDEGEGVRRTVNSFEQYWKTWDTIRKKVLGDGSAVASQTDPNTVPATPATAVATEAGKDNRTYLTDVMEWHSYEQWAYAKRWNGYNISGKTSKGWELIEHWYQTVQMGEGYFDLVPITIDPALILLDQHGWEIMRKPLPSSADDPELETKHAALRVYDSPMVKEYHFWSNASKRSGFHQYYNLGRRISENGVNYSSTSLGSLPPIDATNVKDAKGNVYDQYVTYVVKDEYVQSLGKPFLIQQGSNYVSTSNGSTITTTATPIGGMSQHIIDNISELTTTGSKNTDLWYLKPNGDIDTEMGYGDAAHEWTNDYTGEFSASGFDPYNIQIQSLKEYETGKYHKFVTNATGATLNEGEWQGTYSETPGVSLGDEADPRKSATWYDSRQMAITNATFMAVQDESGNMQLMPRFDQTRRMKDFTTLTTATEDAATRTKLYRPLVYNYLIIDNSGNESLRYQSGGDLTPQTPEWFKSQLAKDFKYYTGAQTYNANASDEATWTAAESTYQKTATSDANMTTQIEALTTSGTYYFKIEYYKKVTVTQAKSESSDAVYDDPIDSNESTWSSAGETYKKTATSDTDVTTQAKALTANGDYYFKVLYYKEVIFSSNTTTTSDGIYSDVANGRDISNREITEESSLAGAGLTTAGSTGNDVYVRYSYDEDADVDKVLQGKWLTMTLNEQDAQYTTVGETTGIYSGTKPTTVDGDDKTWQWKFLATPQSAPDPYAVSLYNRSQNGTATTVNSQTKFALLNWYDGSGINANAYTLAVAGNKKYTYDFVNGASMSTSNAATTNTESGFLSTSCSYNNTDAKIVLTDDVEHTFIYKIYTNSSAFAVGANQDNATVVDNGYVPTLPDEIKSPLLNSDQFRYYEALTDTAANSGKQLKYLYGLYDDIVYVRYNAYDDKKTTYKVPNVKTVVDSKVARDDSSNDASLDISGQLIYNIIWYDDNMMRSTDGSTVSGHASQILQGGNYVWQFEGYDPYAIKIKHQSSGKYAVGTSTLETVAANASPSKTFMLLPSDDDWDYGVLQVTGGTGILSDYGQTTVTSNPTKFIIFGLSTNKVIYHLVIANIGDHVDIPYSEKNTDGSWKTGYSPSDNKTKRIDGSTCRDLTTATSGVTGDKYQLGVTKSINSSSVTYCVDQGHITLGDSLKVPQALLRPNCKYFFYVGGIYSDNACTEPANSTDATPVTLDSKYKGLQVKYMGKDADLLGTTVVVNIEYQFDDGLPTNNGSDFVTNTTGTQWYTFETSEATPYLAHYTYKDAKLTGVEGRVGHYTNDFLWSPVGDPYGFKMYNRYVYKNGGETTNVMTTASIAANQNFVMGATASNAGRDIYELLPSSTDGYFKVQTLTAQGGTPYYIDNTSGTMQLKSSTTSEWTFSLSDALLEPYYLGAGNVGGLTTSVKDGTSKTKSGKTLYEEATTLMEKQGVVFDADNIVDFTPGYYRIFSEPNSLNITIPRYLSGYTHKTELTEDIPMHFYEKEGVTTTFDVLGSGFTTSAATRGQIPIVAPEYDPASIFYISGSGPYTMQTQGLYVDGAVMAASTGTHSNFYVTDIGGAVVVLHDGKATIADRYYLNYDQTDANHIYDVKYTNNIGIADATKWCMEPANKKGVWIETHSGGEEAVLTDLWYYSSYCVPFDMLIQNKNEDDGDGKGVHSSNAYTCVADESPWSEDGLHPKPIGKYNTGTYKDNDYFVPAGTPVLFSTKRATEYIKATIPTTTPSTSILTIFSYKYLEQIISDTYDDSRRVYVFGPKMEGTMTVNESTGVITAVLPSLGNTNVGFHLNANPNKEAGLTIASWTRNNYYVLHNKIYYQVSVSPGVKRLGEIQSAPQFVPVIFDYDEEGGELQPDGQIQQQYDGDVYDLSGRKVATEDQVKDGTWKQILRPGIYIVGGKKIKI